MALDMYKMYLRHIDRNCLQEIISRNNLYNSFHGHNDHNYCVAATAEMKNCYFCYCLAEVA